MAVLYILCVGTLNLVVGFGVAVYAARRYQVVSGRVRRVATATRPSAPGEPETEVPSDAEDALGAVEEFLSDAGIRPYEAEADQADQPHDAQDLQEPQNPHDSAEQGQSIPMADSGESRGQAVPDAQGNPPTEKADDEATEKTAQKATEQAAEKAAEEVAEKATKQVAEKATEEVAQKTAQKPTEKRAQKATEEVTEKATEEAAQKTAQQATEKRAQKVTEQVAEKATEEAAQKTAQKPTEKRARKATEEAAEKTAQKPTEKRAQKATEEVTEKTAQKATEETAEQAAEKAAQKVTEEVAEKTAQKATEEASDAQGDAKSEQPSLPENDPANRLPSIEAQSPAESAVLDLREQVEKFHQELTALDEELRQGVQNPSPPAIETCLESFSRSNDKQLESCVQAQKVFRKFCEDIEEFHIPGDDLLAAVEEESLQIRQTNEAIQNFDRQDDLADGCRQMLAEASQLINANHHLRDATEEAFVGVMRSEQRLDTLDDFARMDPLTGVLGRGGLEAAFSTMRAEDPDRSRQLCLAMFDLDQFGRVNEQFGQNVGDRVLHIFAQLLDTETSDQARVARHSGQRFAVMLPDTDVRTASNVAERIRQSLELVQFHTRNDEFKVTVSCAVVEPTADDTTDSLFSRAEAAMEEAKRYGRNRTFLHEGDYSTPVIPPSFTLSEKVVPL